MKLTAPSRLSFFHSSLAVCHQVFIDSNGDAEGNYTVVSMLPLKRTEGDDQSQSSGVMELNYVMQPVGYFQYNATSPHELPVNKTPPPT